VNDWAAMLMQDPGPVPDGLGQEFWMAPSLPYAVRQRIEIVFEVLSHLPLAQPVAVISDGGKTIAANQPLLDLIGCPHQELVGRMWSTFMQGWPDRARNFRREGEQLFEEHLGRAEHERTWVRVSLGPVSERGEQRAMAYVLFISKPDVETIDHDEVRRLRKSLQLLADTQTDYVVEIDRDGVMTFASPSFCRAVGAEERELVGHAFLSRVCAADQGAAEVGLESASRPPFTGEMRASLAADRDKPIVWQIEAVIGDGIVGLDLVGRVAAVDAAQTAAPVSPALQLVPAPADPRLAAIADQLSTLKPGDRAGLMALARSVAEAAGAECVLYNVMRDDVVETAVGWRLPPSSGAQNL